MVEMELGKRVGVEGFADYGGERRKMGGRQRGRRKDGAERRREGRVREDLLSPEVLHVMSAAKKEN